ERYALAPIDIRVIEDSRSTRRTSGEFVEVRNIVWKRVNRRPCLPHKQHGNCTNTSLARCQARHNSTRPYKQQGQNGQQIPEANLIGSDRIDNQIKTDSRNQNDFAPTVDQSFLEISEREYQPQQCGNRCFEYERGQKVVPPTAVLQLAEQIEWIIGNDLHVYPSAISKIEQRRFGKQICSFDHQQRSTSHDQQSSQCATPVPGNTHNDDECGQESSRELAGHRGAERQARVEVAAFPKQIERQNREHRKRHIRRNQHPVSQQVWRERIETRSEQACSRAEQVSCPQERDDQSNGRKSNHCRPAPKQQPVGFVLVKKIETEGVFGAAFPGFIIRIELWMNEHQ